MTPPPTAVVSPRIEIPSMSMRFSRPSSAPDTAKATVPAISKARSRISDIIYLLNSIVSGCLKYYAYGQRGQRKYIISEGGVSTQYEQKII